MAKRYIKNKTGKISHLYIVEYNEKTRCFQVYFRNKMAGSVTLGDDIEFETLSDEEIADLVTMAILPYPLNVRPGGIVNRDKNGRFYIIKKAKAPKGTMSLYTRNRTDMLTWRTLLVGVEMVLATAVAVEMFGYVQLRPLALLGSFVTVIATVTEVVSQLRDTGELRIL